MKTTVKTLAALACLTAASGAFAAAATSCMPGETRDGVLATRAHVHGDKPVTIYKIALSDGGRVVVREPGHTEASEVGAAVKVAGQADGACALAK